MNSLESQGPTGPAAARGERRRRAPAAALRRTGWIAMIVLAAATALITSRYLTLDPDTFLTEQRAVYLAHLLPLTLHVGGGVLAILLGPWQFLPRLRARRPVVHRVAGRGYLVAALVTGAAGLFLVPDSMVGPIAPIGFAVLDILLLATSAAGFAAARRGAIARHRAWMTRSYGLIFAAATLRVWLTVMPAVGVPFEQAYATAAWTSWLINLLVAEHVIARGPGPRPGRDRSGTGA
ncbi:DUF2306 domain-containing protein [Kitasatospora sp. NPDC092286]|uniref:DUF2306 domain-containing protein n=1 Tax=Kitasatospora sp. NPDC092286 TaxID=3364087 RepID=UPI00382BCF90